MRVKRVLKLAAIGLAVVLLVAVGAFGWATIVAESKLARTVQTHSVSFPVPFPLSPDELAQLGIGADEGGALALERALERGRHLVEARYACVECHGSDFAGGVMIDDPLVGRFLGPNLTMGEGSRTARYTPADWDRIVRHGVKPDGTPAAMPSEDFRDMSDQELSDIVAYIRTRPPMFGEVPASTPGPLGKVLLATGALKLSADLVPDHYAAHRSLPPDAAATVEFGAHLGGICRGCHRDDLTGGPIPGGDPAWVPARNLTPHEEGLAGWTLDDFERALREGRRPDGTALREPMTLMMPYAQRMTDVEIEALWLYLQSVEPRPTSR